MRVWILIGSLSVFLLGCASNSHTIGAQGVDIALNLGFEHERELEQIQSALISAGIPCNQRAMSCNEAPLVVNRADFERARAIAVETVVQDSLTVRLYTSPTGWDSPLEVWEAGQKTREEPHRLYPLSEETVRSIKAWGKSQEERSK